MNETPKAHHLACSNIIIACIFRFVNIKLFIDIQ